VSVISRNKNRQWAANMVRLLDPLLEHFVTRWRRASNGLRVYDCGRWRWSYRYRCWWRRWRWRWSCLYYSFRFLVFINVGSFFYTLLVHIVAIFWGSSYLLCSSR
jgi:hypothetical protein